MSADELSVKLTTRDELTGKLKEVRSAIKNATNDLTDLNKHLDSPAGKTAYDDARHSLSQLSLEEKRLRSEMGKNERAIRSMGTTSTKSAEKTRKSWTTATKLGIAAAGTAAVVAAKKIWTAAKSITTGYESAVKSARGLQRQFGGSIADASRLGHAMRMSGLDIDKAGTALSRYAKNIDALQQAQTDANARAKESDQAMKDYYKTLARLGPKADATKLAMKDWAKAESAANRAFKKVDSSALGQAGVSVLTKSGDLRSTKAILGDTADVFAKLQDGPTKTALAMKIFGKSGKDMIPFLEKGKAGIADLMAEADRLGITLTGKDKDSVMESVNTQRKFNEALLGVKTTLAREVFPQLIKFGDWMNTKGVPLLRSMVDWVKRNSSAVKTAGAVLAIAIGVIGASTIAMKVWRGAVTAWTVASKIAWAAQVVWTNAQIAFNLAMQANPIGLVVLAIVALVAILVLAYKKVGWFRAAVQSAWSGIKKAASAFVGWFKETAWPAIRTVLGWIGGYYRTMWGVAKTVWNGVTNTVSTAIGKIKAGISGVKTSFSRVWDGVSGAAKSAFNGIAKAWNSTIGALSWTVPSWVWGIGGKTISVPNLPTFWQGGPVAAGTKALVGEIGPELFVPNTGRPRVIGADGPEIRDFAQAGVIIPNHLMPMAPVVLRQREREPAMAGASVHIGTINAASNVDVEGRVLHAMMRADRISRERR